jgi:hypothetical protein
MTAVFEQCPVPKLVLYNYTAPWCKIRLAEPIAGPDIARLLWNKNAHYGVQKTARLGPIWSRFNPFHSLLISVRIILMLATLVSSERPLPFGFPD